MERKSDMEPMQVLFAARGTLTRSEFSYALSQAGFNVTVVDNGVQCLEAFHRSVPDALIIEPELPWGGGDGVLAIIQEEWAWQEVAVLVLSIEQCRSAMYSIARFTTGDFLTGSVSAGQLVDRINRLVHRRRTQMAAKTDR